MCNRGQGTPNPGVVYRRAPRERDGQPLIGFLRCPQCAFNCPVYGSEPGLYAAYKCPNSERTGNPCKGILKFHPLEDSSGE